MKDTFSLFNQVAKVVMQRENYIPRNYKTVGGMWTVDTYKRGDITLQLMDEGWSTRIFNDVVCITDRGGQITFEKGTLDDLKLMVKSLN